MRVKDAVVGAAKKLLLKVYGTSEEELERKEAALNRRIHRRAGARQEAARRADDLLDREVAPETARRIKSDPTLEDFFDGFGLGDGGGRRCGG